MRQPKFLILYSAVPNIITDTRLASTGPSTNHATTTTSSHTTLSTSKIPTTSTKAVCAAGGFIGNNYEYSGCFQDIMKGHALPLLFANNSVTPELCEAYIQSLANKPTPTVLPYFYVESRKQCYGGSSFSWGKSAVTSLIGTKACSDVCAGSLHAAMTGTAKCGGPKEFNLYTASGAAPLKPAATVHK
jgi:hypothetical protein